MRYDPLHVLAFIVAGLRALATSLPPQWGSMRVKHAWNTVPKNWECLGHPPAGTTIDLHIALRSQHENALIDALLEVSNPTHLKYGAYLSREQVAELVAPHSDTLRLANSWLEQHGVPSSMISITHGGSWLTVSDVQVSQANEFLGASYRLYRHTPTNSTVLRTISYGLPAELHAHVRTVAPTTYFGSPRTSRRTSPERPIGGAAVLSSRNYSDDDVTPSYLRWLYKTMGYAPAARGQNTLGIGGFLDDYPSPDDLRLFMNEYRTDGADATFDVIKVKGGGYNPRNPSLEASNNVQYASAIAYPTPLIFYSTRGTSYDDDMFLNWLSYLDLAEWVCLLFAQLGLRGVSVIFASGDDGVGKGGCKDQDGNVHFLPNFPASCPWITSVGGTTNHDPEVAASISSGGFSNYFSRPLYQDNAQAVATFLENLGSLYDGRYNPEGRGIPDISAQALDFMIVKNREFRSYEGTSCSAPTVAGIVSLLNDYLISKGKAPLGFLNPWLYGRGRAGLNDITSGSNPGCDTDGFPALAGWDPVTGLGTPDFDKLEEILDRQ